MTDCDSKEPFIYLHGPFLLQKEPNLTTKIDVSLLSDSSKSHRNLPNREAYGILSPDYLTSYLERFGRPLIHHKITPELNEVIIPLRLHHCSSGSGVEDKLSFFMKWQFLGFALNVSVGTLTGGNGE